MDNRELIERAGLQRGRTEDISAQLCIGSLIDALERSESQLTKYRAAPTVGYLQGHAFYGAHQTRPVANEAQLIARPEVN